MTVSLSTSVQVEDTTMNQTENEIKGKRKKYSSFTLYCEHSHMDKRA